MKKIFCVLLVLCLMPFAVNAKVEVYFSPSNKCEKGIVEAIDDADTEIEAAVYAINNDNIVEALKKAHDRGVKIKILTDRLQAANKSSKVKELYDYGINIRVHSKHKIEHNKFAVFDNESVVTGSYNWTNPATNKNSENCVFFIRDKDAVEEYDNRFKYLWQINTKKKSDLWFKKKKKRLRKEPLSLFSLFALKRQSGDLRLGMSQNADDPDQGVFHLLAGDNNIYHTVVTQIFRTLEAVRQLFTDGLLNNTRAGKAYQAALFGDINITQHRKRGRDTAGGRVSHNGDKRNPFILKLIDGSGGACHLHQRQYTFLHAGAAGRGYRNQRIIALEADFGCLDNPLAYGHAHRAAHKRKVHYRNNAGDAADFAFSDANGVIVSGRLAISFQTVRIALGILKLQRVIF